MCLQNRIGNKKFWMDICMSSGICQISYCLSLWYRNHIFSVDESSVSVRISFHLIQCLSYSSVTINDNLMHVYQRCWNIMDCQASIPSILQLRYISNDNWDKTFLMGGGVGLLNLTKTLLLWTLSWTWELLGFCRLNTQYYTYSIRQCTDLLSIIASLVM